MTCKQVISKRNAVQTHCADLLVKTDSQLEVRVQLSKQFVREITVQTHCADLSVTTDSQLEVRVHVREKFLRGTPVKTHYADLIYYLQLIPSMKSEYN